MLSRGSHHHGGLVCLWFFSFLNCSFIAFYCLLFSSLSTTVPWHVQEADKTCYQVHSLWELKTLTNILGLGVEGYNWKRFQGCWPMFEKKDAYGCCWTKTDSSLRLWQALVIIYRTPTLHSSLVTELLCMRQQASQGGPGSFSWPPIHCFKKKKKRQSHVYCFYGFLKSLFCIRVEWLRSKESACNVGATGDGGPILGSGRPSGGGHSKSLQYSCLENPTDVEAWWVTVHRVAKSQTWLKWLSTHIAD